MEVLLQKIRACRECAVHLPHAPRPVIRASRTARLLVIGQAPGTKVHACGTPWMDASGRQLRTWMDIDDATFYDESRIAIMPMGFCYPGKGRSGDLPPRAECAPLWHPQVRNELQQIQLTLLIGQYAQRYYLGDNVAENLTETVRAFRRHLPAYLPMPHPSPRNRLWLAKNPWFETDLVPVLRAEVARVLGRFSS